MNIDSQDINKLEKLYNLARLALPQITYQKHYPVYPSPINQLMKYIAYSSWCNHAYDPKEAYDLIDHIEDCSLLDLRSILTWANRGERFCNGHWINILQSDLFPKAINRARILLQESQQTQHN